MLAFSDRPSTKKLKFNDWDPKKESESIQELSQFTAINQLKQEVSSSDNTGNPQIPMILSSIQRNNT